MNGAVCTHDSHKAPRGASGKVAAAPRQLHAAANVHRPPTGVVGRRWSADYLGHCDAALLCQLLFSLLAGIGVTEVRVEILV